MKYFKSLTALVCLFLSLTMNAQTYEAMWKKVTELREKDHPQSAIAQLREIEQKATREKQTPQLLKAYLSRLEINEALSADSLRSPVEQLLEWEAKETRPLDKAVLNLLLGMYSMEKETPLKEILLYFDKAVADKELLGSTSASAYHPLSKSQELSRDFFEDNMLDLFVRQITGILLADEDAMDVSVRQKEAGRYYDLLIDYYDTKGKPEAAALTRYTRMLSFSQYTILRPYKTSKKDLTTWLENAVVQYKGKPAGAVFMASLTEEYIREKKYTQALGIVEEALRLYPKSKYKEYLQYFRHRILAPSVEANIDKAYPGTSTSVEIAYRNVKQIELKWYRLDLSPAEIEKLKRTTDITQIKKTKHAHLHATNTFELPATPDYKKRVETRQLPLPEAGIYIVETWADGKHIERDRLYHLSPYTFVTSMAENNKVEVVLLDRQSGFPLKDVTFCEYDYQTFDVKLRHVPDAQGRILLPWEAKDGRAKWCNVKGKQDFMEINHMYRPYFGFGEKRDDSRHTLLTDRGVYRPGQTVQVSGVTYAENGDKREAETNQQIILSFRDANDKEIQKETVVTDTYGAFSAHFLIPRDVLNGTFSIRTDRNSTYIRVEEYKLPTFEVKINEYKDAYTWDDTITVTGQAQLLAGAPVRGGKAKYTIYREQMSWWRSTKGRTTIASGEVVTDENGKFSFPLFFAQQESNDNEFFYHYKAEVSVTDVAGETQDAGSHFYISRYSLRSNISGLPAEIDKDNLPKVVLSNRNLQQTLVDTPVVWELCKRTLPAKQSYDDMDEDGYGDYTIPQRAKGAVILSGEMVSGQVLDMRDWSKIASGEYTLWVRPKGEGQEENLTHQDVVLFSTKDRKIPVSAKLWYHPLNSEFSETQPAEFLLGVGCKDAYVFCHIYAGETRVESHVYRLDEEMKHFRLPYKKEYGEGIKLLFGFMKEDEWHEEQGVFTYVVPEKELVLRWETFRDKLRPGDKEEWILTVTDKQGKTVDARMMATMYDTALDAIQPFGWKFGLDFYRNTPSTNFSTLSSNNWDFNWRESLGYVSPPYLFDKFWSYSAFELPFIRRSVGHYLMGNVYGVLNEEIAVAYATPMMQKTRAVATDKAAMSSPAESDVEQKAEIPALRTNFAENAFFYPHLRTDAAGRVQLVFTMPDVLTRWKFLGFAHTRGMDYGLTEKFVTTSKEFMIQPNLPRYLRVGDKGTISASLINLSEKTVRGTAVLQLIDPMTEKVLLNATQTFDVAASATGSVTFACPVDEEWGLVICRMTAKGDTFSDGEQRYLPVLTNKQWVMESRPFQIVGAGEETISTETLFGKQSKDSQHKTLTVELAANAGWYAIQSLPAVAETQEEDLFSHLSAYFGNAVSANILKQQPQLRTALSAWKADAGQADTWMSKLAQNPELKQIALEQSPWLKVAEGENERRARMVDFFNENTLNNRQQTAVRKMLALQQTDGSFAWFPGMDGGRYTTLYVTVLLARLQAMGVPLDDKLQTAYRKAVNYVAKEVKRIHSDDVEDDRRGRKSTHVSEFVLNYLYVSAIDRKVFAEVNPSVAKYYLAKLQRQSSPFTIYGKANIAIIMQAYGRTKKADELLRSIEEYSVYRKDMGRYFDTYKAIYSWRSYRIPTQVAALEAIHRLRKDEKTVGEMQLWLLKQKQVQEWGSPVATAEAIYALLLGNSTLATQGTMTAQVGTHLVQSGKSPLGYAKQAFVGADAEVKDIKVQKTGESTGWGAVFAQYQTTIDNVQASEENGLAIGRRYLKDGKEITAETPLRVGDKVRVELTLRVDRDMDFVQVRERRPACLEPLTRTSGYTWEGGIGFYRSVKDSEMHFFMDVVRKGTYIIVYETYADRVGTYHAGDASVQSAYAPEFGSHTAGTVLKVQ